MEAFETIRSAALRLHAELVSAGTNPDRPMDMVLAAIKQLDLELAWLPKDDPTLKGARALYDEQAGIICAADEGDEATRAGLIAHEIGHACIHSSSSQCTHDDIDPSRSTEAAPVGLQRVEDYGAHERRELQANVFAREFLLPRSLAREKFLSGQTASAITRALKISKDIVRQQLLDALLLPPAPPEEDGKPDRPLRPDPSQDRAAEHRESAFQLQAGPGAGKTRTLVKRVLSLLKDGVAPDSILVLTFSNRAAGELSERLTLAAPDAAPQIWIGTFHAFGLDLIRRYHQLFDLSPDPPLFDRSDAIEVLEDILPTLDIVHYRNLWDPAMVLRDIVAAISRAKDELTNAKKYAELAKEQLDLAKVDAFEDVKAREKAIENAEKALEVARVYKLYEDALQKRKAVDFGDLIMRPALLLERDDAVRAALQLRHRHVLVDEYQDVNRASARLLKALAGDGRRLWVVGDARQSIYRFRGASSVNMLRFAKEYPDVKVDRLSVNYRSSEEVINIFQAVAPRMAASVGMLPLKLESNFGPSGILPELRDFELEEDEYAGVAASIRELEKKGVRLRDQAILCRTNTSLNDIAKALEARGIPVLHLGSLFERDEIRDLLALLTLAVDPFGDGLARVGAIGRYDLPLQDIHTAISLLRKTTGPAASKISAIAGDAAFSSTTQQALNRLAADLADIPSGRSPWEFLATYLLDRTDVLARLAERQTIRDRMRAVAIWQFLNFVRDRGPLGAGAPIQRMLDRVRQLVLLAEERDLRQIPASALHMDAVRLMTIHGSKGLEFDAVHIPGLNVGSIPSSYRGQRCPPPNKMIEGDVDASTAHDMEEECLFFVALSRAKQHLRLYKCRKRDTGKARNPSEFLSWVTANVITQIAKPATMPLPPDAPTMQPIMVTWPEGWSLTNSRLTGYERCARRFFYTHVLGLGGGRKPTPFTRTHDCLYELMEWLAGVRLEGAGDEAKAAQEFERVWGEQGPVDHAYAVDYRRLADRLVGALVRAGAGKRFRRSEPIAVDLPSGRVTVEPDEMMELPNGTVVLRRVRTGYKRDKEYERLEYRLYHLAGQARFAGGYIVEALHLTDEIVEQVPTTPTTAKNAQTKSDAMLAKIAAGEFPPDPDAVTCPRCPHFFVCDAVGRGPLKVS